MKGRRSSALAAAVALTLTACTVSRVDPEASVSLRGTLLDVDGRPQPGTELVLIKEVDLGAALVGLTLAVGTLGLVCLVDEASAPCARARRTTTAADGRFSFELAGRDTQSLVGGASTFHLSAGLPAAPGEARGPAVTARFEIQTTDIELPGLRFWRPRVAVSTASPSVTAAWPGLGGDYGALGGYGLTFSGLDGRAVWTVSDASSPATVDARALEDTRGVLAVDAFTTGSSARTKVRVNHRSAQIAYSGTAGPPPSRGATCRGEANAGETRPPPAGCGLTDGDLVSPARLSGEGTTAAVMTAAAVDLGRARPVALVIVRGCPAGCVVESSPDARTWAPVGAGDGQQIVVTPRASTTARFVRVASATGLDISRLAEVSVW